MRLTRSRRPPFLCMLVVLKLMLGSVTAEAQSRADVNSGTVGIISGPVSGTYARFAQDLSDVLDDPGRIRVLAVLGKGSEQNVNDLLYLRGIDVAIVQSDVLTEFGNRIANIERQISYVTRLHNEELHILAQQEITSLNDLAGKKVNVGQTGSGTTRTSSIVFEALGIKVVPDHKPDNEAVEALKKGEVSAVALVAGKPVPLFHDIPRGSGLHFLKVSMAKILEAPMAKAKNLDKIYVESTLTEHDYPNLIPPILSPPEIKNTSTIDTIAVSAILAVFNHRSGTERQAKVNKFVEEFFKVLQTRLQRDDSFHKKWKEVKIECKVLGWTRYKINGITPTTEHLC
jgi:uncharacterized protein